MKIRVKDASGANVVSLSWPELCGLLRPRPVVYVHPCHELLWSPDVAGMRCADVYCIESEDGETPGLERLREQYDHLLAYASTDFGYHIQVVFPLRVSVPCSIDDGEMLPVFQKMIGTDHDIQTLVFYRGLWLEGS